MSGLSALEAAHLNRITKCRTCQARIIFLPTAAGKSMPVNAVTVEPEHQQFDPELDHESHFVTCPGAAKHRKPKK